MGLFDIFKKKESSKTDNDTTCNHSDALPNGVFCPKCGHKIERTAAKTSNSKRIINFDIKNCYICVLHFRCISAWVTPTSHPVKKYVVVYNGKYKDDFIECSDEGTKLKIKANSETITLKFENHDEELAYSINEVCNYHIPICDAMESWSFIISDTPILHELFVPGYQQQYDSIYYNIEDMIENQRKLDNMFKKFN